MILWSDTEGGLHHFSGINKETQWWTHDVNKAFSGFLQTFQSRIHKPSYPYSPPSNLRPNSTDHLFNFNSLHVTLIHFSFHSSAVKALPFHAQSSFTHTNKQPKYNTVQLFYCHSLVINSQSITLYSYFIVTV